MPERDRLFALRWKLWFKRDFDSAPLLPPLFVLEQGPNIHLVDLRPKADATGVAGFIPGSVFVAPERLDALAEEIPKDLPLILVSGSGRAAAQWARRLELRGLERVAALAGGLVAWRQMGLRTSREPAKMLDRIVERPDRETAARELSLDDVRDHIGDPGAVRWTKFTSLVSHGRVFCVDGRDVRGVIGTPGGDAGEFLLAMAALERATGARLDGDALASALQAHLDTFGDFYMHTDEQALDALLAAIREDERARDAVADVAELEQWFETLQRPPQAVRAALRVLVVEPAHIGCGHLRLMLQHGTDYGVRPELITSFLRAVFELWWKGAPELHLSSLRGGHEESAVVNVLLDEEPWAMSWVPLISPACAGTQMFVNHPQITRLFRDVVIDFHARGLGPVKLDASGVEVFRSTLGELGDRHLRNTLSRLAKGLPVYDVVFAQDGTFEVREAGAISA